MLTFRHFSPVVAFLERKCINVHSKKNNYDSQSKQVVSGEAIYAPLDNFQIFPPKEIKMCHYL